MTRPPHCFASVSSSGLRRPVAMILASACASAIAVALPMPALAPVTSTALPDNGMLIRPPLDFMDHNYTQRDNGAKRRRPIRGNPPLRSLHRPPRIDATSARGSPFWPSADLYRFGSSLRDPPSSHPLPPAH